MPGNINTSYKKDFVCTKKSKQNKQMSTSSC